MTSYIETHRERFGVEPICRTLQVAPSSYYAARHRPLSARRVRDEALKVKLRQVHAEHFGVYGARKLWRQLQREGIPVARCTVERVMRALGLAGVVRGRYHRTTVSDEVSPRPADLVERNFRAAVPNRLWVADLTYVRTWSGFAYVAFIIDVFSTPHGRCAPTSHSTRSSRRSGVANAPVVISAGSCTTATGVCNTSRSATPNASPRPVP